MRRFFINLAAVISVLSFAAFFSISAFAQSSSKELKNNSSNETVVVPQTGTAYEGKNELSVTGGFAPNIKSIYGGSRRSKFGFVSLRYSRHLIGSKNVALKYTFDVIPVAFINYDKRIVIQTAPNTIAEQRENTTVYGLGLTPVGFQLNFRRGKKVQPFLTASAGLIRFAKTIPDDRSEVFPNRYGRQFNYTLAAGGGVEFATEEGKSFTLGFKFHHISNASTGNINPGFDQNLFYVGYTFKKW